MDAKNEASERRKAGTKEAREGGRKKEKASYLCYLSMSVILGIMVSRYYLVDGESEKLWVWGVRGGDLRSGPDKPPKTG